MVKSIAKLLALLLLLLLFSSAALALENGVYRDKAEGYGGDVIVTVIIRDGRIQSLATENTGGEKSEYYLKAEEGLSKAIVAANGLDGVDAVAGATGTSESILTAMRGILEQAAYTGAPLGAVNELAEETKNAVQNVAEDVKDGVDNAINSVKEPTLTAAPKPTV